MLKKKTISQGQLIGLAVERFSQIHLGYGGQEEPSRGSDLKGPCRQ